MSCTDVLAIPNVRRVPAFLISACSGLALGLSLIVAIGGQNAYLLRQGLRGDRVWLVAVIFVVSDIVLIAAGVAGAGAVLDRWRQIAVVARLAGAAFLGGYAVLAARRMMRPAGLDVSDPVEGSGDRRSAVATAVLTALALTWLNPHVYLDTVVLLGAVAQGQAGGRWAFAAGAAVASLTWFTALGRGAALLRPLFARPTAWRVLDGAIAAMMATLAITLVAAA